MKRRDFLKKTALAGASLATWPLVARSLGTGARAEGISTNAATLPKRRYGRTGIRLSIVGLGGVVVAGMDQSHANRVVARCVERGVNYFDVAPSYGDAELKFGPALKPYRKNVFLACKTLKRDRAGAAAELKRSLERLKTDYLDLYQLHALTHVEKDVDRAFSKGGAMEVLIEAKRTGQVRHLGFSAHSVEAALKAMERYDFDSILFPVNFACAYKGNFGPQVIEAARSRRTAVLAIKTQARQKWPPGEPKDRTKRVRWYQPLTDPREAELGLRFALSQPMVAAVVPPGEESLFWTTLELALRFKPLTVADERELRELAAGLNPLFRAEGG